MTTSPAQKAAKDSAPLAVDSRVSIQQTYSKHHTFAVHGLPETHHSQWPPQITIQANPRYTDLGEGRHELVLGVQLQGKQGETLVFELQIEYAGLFVLEQIPAEKKRASCMADVLISCFPR